MRPDKVTRKPVCKECGTLLLTNFEDLDRQIYVWCRRCGLIRDSKYTMGKTIKSLIKYTKKHNIGVDDQRLVTSAYDAYGLRVARITVARILNGEQFQSKSARRGIGMQKEMQHKPIKRLSKSDRCGIETTNDCIDPWDEWDKTQGR